MDFFTLFLKTVLYCPYVFVLVAAFLFAAVHWSTTHRLLLAVGLYYAVLAFNLGMTFWIGEWHMGIRGVLMYLPVTAWLMVRLTGCLLPVGSFVLEPSTSPGSIQTRDFV